MGVILSLDWIKQLIYNVNVLHTPFHFQQLLHYPLECKIFFCQTAEKILLIINIFTFLIN